MQVPFIGFVTPLFFHQGTHPHWIGGDTEALEGFSWRGGSERDTTGILLWSKPYIKTLPSGEEVCSRCTLITCNVLTILGGLLLRGSNNRHICNTVIMLLQDLKQCLKE